MVVSRHRRTVIAMRGLSICSERDVGMHEIVRTRRELGRIFDAAETREYDATLKQEESRGMVRRSW